MNDSWRLQKFLAHAGVASRRSAEQLILQGKIQVNDRIIDSLGAKIDPRHDVICVDGKTVTFEKHRTFLFYKPVGVVTTMHDEAGRQSVADYFKQVKERVYPVGRLDYATSGLLIMTNDGQLANSLMHPRYKIDKVYTVTVCGYINDDALANLRSGVCLSDGVTSPAKVLLLHRDSQCSRFQMTIKEGRNRQIRRMSEAVGHKVTDLIRVSIAHLTLENLFPGQFRELSEAEINRLQSNPTKK